MSKTEFVKENYKFQSEFEETKKHKVPNVLGAQTKVDAWRHNRSYDMLLPLYNSLPGKSWITIGDSGADAEVIKRRGVNNVVASSLSASRLHQLQDEGYLAGIEVKSINAEDSQEEDDSFDIVFCKEAYHHFPRPAIGFYELLRISKIGVCYIEPNTEGRTRLLNYLKVLAKSILRKEPKDAQNFETAGNYIYRVMPQEFIQMATAIQLPVVAYKNFNDFFVMKICDQDQAVWWAMPAYKFGIKIQNLLCHLRLMSWGLVSIVVFKSDPGDQVIAELAKAGYTIKNIPRNPYLDV